MVGSWLLDLTMMYYGVMENLASSVGELSDSGEGRWTVHYLWILVYPHLLYLLPSLRGLTQED